MLPASLRLFLALTLCVTLGWMGAARAEPPVTVFAAASLKNALDDVAARFETETGLRVSLSYGGSSALARQIQYGAPAQVFLSANADWMDMLQTQGLLEPGSRVNLLTNRLVLIAGPETEANLIIKPNMDLTSALRGERLAMALVDAVPAGIYGRAALQSLGVWDDVRANVAQTDNVRAALRLVAVGEAPLGIVYATDAAAAGSVRLVGAFPADSHTPIVYPAALLAETGYTGARAFFAFLKGTEARAVFAGHGFGIPDGDGS